MAADRGVVSFDARGLHCDTQPVDGFSRYFPPEKRVGEKIAAAAPERIIRNYFFGFSLIFPPRTPNRQSRWSWLFVSCSACLLPLFSPLLFLPHSSDWKCSDEQRRFPFSIHHPSFTPFLIVSTRLVSLVSLPLHSSLAPSSSASSFSIISFTPCSSFRFVFLLGRVYVFSISSPNLSHVAFDLQAFDLHSSMFSS